MKHLAYVLVIFILSTFISFHALFVLDALISSLLGFPVSLLLGYPISKPIFFLLLSALSNAVIAPFIIFNVQPKDYRRSGKLRQLLYALIGLVLTGILSIDSGLAWLFNKKTTPLLHLPRSIGFGAVVFLLHQYAAAYIVRTFRKNIQKTIYRIFGQPPDFFESYDKFLDTISIQQEHKAAREAFQHYTGEYIYLPLKTVDEHYLKKLEEKMMKDVQKGILTKEAITQHMNCYQQVVAFAQTHP